MQEEAGTFLLASGHMPASKLYSLVWFPNKAPSSSGESGSFLLRGKALPSWGAFILLLFHLFLTYIFITCQTWDKADRCWVLGTHCEEDREGTGGVWAGGTHREQDIWASPQPCPRVPLALSSRDLMAVDVLFSPTALPILGTADPCLHMDVPKDPKGAPVGNPDLDQLGPALLLCQQT